MLEMEKRSHRMPGEDTEGGKLAVQQAMHSQYVLQLLQLQRHAGFLCDITVNIQEKSFKAHKPLLAACSLYFRALFADSESAKTSTLNFEKLSCIGFEVLLDYIYSGSLAITAENSDQVLHAANCLQMTNVVETCLNFVRSSFKATTGGGASKSPPQVHDTNGIRTGAQPAESPGNLNHIAHIIPQTSQPALQNSGLRKQIEIVSRQPALHSNQSPQDVQENLTSNVTYHETDSTVTFKAPLIQASANQLDIVTDPMRSQSPTYSLRNPSETLTTLMPYLVAKNARRPTLHEVRRLLLGGQEHDPGATAVTSETEDRCAVTSNQPPPALILASEAQTRKAKSHPSTTKNEMNVLDVFQRGLTSTASSEAPLNMAVPRKIQRSTSQQPYADGNTANHATVHAALSFDFHNSHLMSNDMQPFVLMTSGDNSLMQRNSQPAGESSKGGAWSDDRSVESDQTHDRKDTHLSGTPCSASLTEDGGGVPRPYQATSPASFGSTPSIEISPESVKMADSPTEPPSMPKLRWLRAQSLDLSKPMAVNKSVNCTMAKSAEDFFRSVSLSPRFFSNKNNNNNNNSITFKRPQPSIKNGSRVPGDHSALISPELAANAVGALFMGTELQKCNTSTLPVTEHSSVDESAESGEDSKLVIMEASDAGDSTSENLIENGKNWFKSIVPTGAKNERYSASRISDEILGVKREPNYTARTSPPPEEVLFTAEQEEEMSRSGSPNTLTAGKVDENGVLDLSIQKHIRTLPVTTSIGTNLNSIKPAVRNHTSVASHQSPKTEVLNALTASCDTPASVYPPTTLDMGDASLTAGYSRKPRRSSGAQICQWAGCGRLFRHRNIFEEHIRLHKLGVPVKQLRRCYMGARVKKTARERLDEMRMTEGPLPVAPQSAGAHRTAGIGVLNLQNDVNRRKRTTTSRQKDADRKKAAVEYGNEPVPALNPPWPQQPGSSQTTIRRTPLHAASVPLAVLQVVGSNANSLMQQRWSGLQLVSSSQVHYTSSGPTLQPSMAGALPVTTDTRQPQQITGATNPAVAETLAALGIPMPTTRSGKERTAALLLSTTQDQKSRTVVTGANTGDGTAVVLTDQLQPTLREATGYAQYRNGNVTGEDARAGSSYCTTHSNHASASNHVSIPNPYHGSLHGSTCS